ncbi:MAG: hypothetical protein UT56_C0002G0054, partial [Candidatus Levybacteria bacterium GW2011_GWB1_39_7]
KNNEILAIIIYNNFKKKGVNFLTSGEFSQQLAFISKKAKEKISAHCHEITKRDIVFAQETLFIKKGKVKINFYSKDKTYFDSRILGKGNVVLLAGGGHGFEFLKDTEMIEVKQGPYLNEDYKIEFKGIEEI